MARIIDAIKILFNTTKSLDQLKINVVESFNETSLKLEKEGLTHISNEDIAKFMLATNFESDPTESILFFQEIIDLALRDRKIKSFYEIKEISLDLYNLTKSEYKEYYDFRNSVEDTYFRKIQDKIRQKVDSVVLEYGTNAFYMPGDDTVH